MYYIVETTKSFDTASRDLEAAVKNNNFGVLYIHNLGETMRAKGVDFKENCKVFEVCNPQQASRVLQNDMRLTTVLPCRISIYTEKGKTFIGMLKPEKILSGLSSDLQLQVVAQEVEHTTIKIIDEAKNSN